MKFSANKYSRFGFRDIIYLTLSDCDLNLYFNQNISECDFDIFRSINTNPFSGVKYLYLTESVKFPKLVCPYALQNLNLSRLIFYLKNSFVKKYVLRFNEKSNHSFKNQIVGIIFRVYRIKVDLSILNELVFGRNTRTISINGILEGMHQDLFKSFFKLKLP